MLERAEPFGEDVEVGESSGVSSLRWTTDKQISPVIRAGEGWDLLVPGTPLHSGDDTVMLTGSSSATDTEDVWRRSRSQLGRAPTRRAWLYPVATAVFGSVRPAGQEQHRDLRDWAAIRNWADDTATQGQRHQPRGLKNEELDHGGTPTRTAV